MKQDTTLTRVTVSADPRTELSPADRLLRTLQSSLAGQFELFGELGRGDGGRIVYLARELASSRLVALQLKPTGERTVGGGEDYWFEIVRTLDGSIPAGTDSNCPRCGKSLGGWGRFCRHCGVDLGGVVPGDNPGAAEELLRDVRAAARGRYEVLGQMERTEGGGIVYFARELANGKLVALRLQREREGAHGTERYNIGLTSVLRPALAAALGVGGSAGPRKVTLDAAHAPTTVAPAPAPSPPPPSPVVIGPPAAVPSPSSEPSAPVSPSAPRLAKPAWRPTRDQAIAFGAAAVTVIALVWFAIARATGKGDDLVIDDPAVDTTLPVASTMMMADSGEVQVGIRLPAGARLRVDGAPVSNPAVKLRAGAHTLSLTAPGYREATQEVTVRAQQTLVWTPQLVRVATSGGSVSPPATSGPAPARSPTPARATPPASRPSDPNADSSRVRVDATPSQPLTDVTTVSCGSLFARLEWSRARIACEEEATRGSVAAQRALGTIYERGLGVTPNAGLATQWYTKAAEAGDAVAQFRLGAMLFSGTGVKKNERQAVVWFRRAADQQHLDAMYMLAQSLERGEGVKKNESEALATFTRAADLGHPRAQTKLGSLYAAGHIVSRDDRASVAWFRKAADQGYAEAQYRLGDMYARGQGVARSDAEADRWFTLAAAQGHERARKALR